MKQGVKGRTRALRGRWARISKKVHANIDFETDCMILVLTIFSLTYPPAASARTQVVSESSNMVLKVVGLLSSMVGVSRSTILP